MFKYNRGDVVWALCPYSDGSGVKHRPAIILKRHPVELKYYLMECTTLKDKHHNLLGKIIKENHTEFANLGFEESTFISFGTKIWLSQHYLKPPPGRSENPIGKCNFINEIDPN